MRKKHDEGYVLIFVLVVISVLSIVAISLMSGALRNLQAQKASVERMQDKYAAEGMIEITVATLKSQLTSDSTVDTAINDKTTLHGPIDQKIVAALSIAAEQVETVGSKEKTLSWMLPDADNGGWKYDEADNGSRIVTIQVQYGSVLIECDLKLENVIVYSTAQSKWNYAAPNFYRYERYSVETTGGAAG